MRCTKVAHPTRKQAWKEAKRMELYHREEMETEGRIFSAYLCKVCCTWHVGSRWNIRTTRDVFSPAPLERTT